MLSVKQYHRYTKTTQYTKIAPLELVV